MLFGIPKAHDEVITSIVFADSVKGGSSNLFCTTSGDDTAALWDIRIPSGATGSAANTIVRGVAQLKYHGGPVNHSLFLPDLYSLLTCSDDRTVARWDMRQWSKPVSVVKGFRDAVNKMLLVDEESMQTIRSAHLQADGSTLPKFFESYRGNATPIVVSACDDGCVYTHMFDDLDSIVTAVSPTNEAAASYFAAQRSGLNSHGYCSCEACVAALCGFGSGEGCAAHTGAIENLRSVGDCSHPELADARIHYLSTQQSAGAPSVAAADQAACVGSNSTGFGVSAAAATVTDTSKSAVLVDRFWAATSTVNDIAIDPINPAILLTGSEDCAIRTWRMLFNAEATTDDRLITSLDEFEQPVNHIALAGDPFFSDDAGGFQEGGSSAQVAGGTGSSTPYRWLFAACAEFVFALPFAPLTGTFGEASKGFSGHRDYVRGLEFCPDSGESTENNNNNNSKLTLLTVSDDSTAIQWNVDDSEPIRQVKLHEGLVMASAMNRQRSVLLSGTDGGEIRGWPLPFQTERLR